VPKFLPPIIDSMREVSYTPKSGIAHCLTSCSLASKSSFSKIWKLCLFSGWLNSLSYWFNLLSSSYFSLSIWLW